MISFKSSFENTSVVVPDTNIFLLIAAAVNSNGIKTLLATGLSTFFIKFDPVLSNGFKSLPKNPPDCPILCSWVFDKLILADEPFAKALLTFETCVLH